MITVGQSGATSVFPGTLRIHGGSGSDTLTVLGQTTVTLDTNLPDAGTPGFGSSLSLTVQDSSTVNFPQSQTLASLTVRDTARVNLTKSNVAANNPHKTLITSSLQLLQGGTLDLTDNALIVHNGNRNTLTSHIARGRNNGNWAGSGITSSAITSEAQNLMAVGILRNDDAISPFSSFCGQPVIVGDMLIRYTYNGDATLNGWISAMDMSRQATGANQSPQDPAWYNGDIDYDGDIDQADYDLIYNNWIRGADATTPLSPTISGATSVAAGTAYSLNLSCSAVAGQTINGWTVYWGDGRYSTVSGNPSSISHTYSQAGTYRIIAAVQGTRLGYYAFQDGVQVTAGPAPVSVSMTNVPASSAEGTAISLGTSLTNTTGQPAIYAWNITAPSGKTYTLSGYGTGSNLTFSPQDNGTYTVSVQAMAGGCPSLVDTRTVTLTNVAPSGVTLGYSWAGQMVNLSGSFTDPGGDDTHTITINWGDGMANTVLYPLVGARSFSSSHPYATAATYTITATVTDDDGGSGGNSIIVPPPSNASPTITSLVASPTSVVAGSSFTLTANGVTDTDGTVSNVKFYRESNGQAGLQTGTGGDTLLDTDTLSPYSTSVSTTGLAAGTYTCYAQASDNLGALSNVASTTVSVSTGGTTYTWQAGTYQWIDLVAGMPGVYSLPALDNQDEAYTTIPLGSNTFTFYGTQWTGSNSLYLNANSLITFGSYDLNYSQGYQNNDLTGYPTQPAIAVAWDDLYSLSNGVLYQFDANRLIIEWSNVRPYGSVNTWAFQAMLQLNTGSTPGDITFNYVDLDSGDSFSNGASATVGIKDGGSNRLLIAQNNANHDNIRSGQAVRITTGGPVPNTPPTITSLYASPTSLDENGTTTLSGSFVDPDSADAHTITINWGDGSPNTVLIPTVGTRSFSATHPYYDDDPSGTSSDAYPVTVTVSDGKATSTPQTATVTVRNVAPSNLVVQGGTATEGTPFTLNGSFTDPGTLDKHTVTITWGDGTPDTKLDLAVGARSFSSSHPYADNGTYPIAVTVSDDDGGSCNNSVSTGGVIAGPDGFGYRAYSPSYQYTDLYPGNPGVNSVLDGTDDNYVAVSLGSNSFNFYGTTYTSLYVSSNGLITFGSGNNSPSNSDLTTSPAERAIATLWDDWVTYADSYDVVLYQFSGNQLIIEWNEVRGYVGSPNYSPSAVSFEAVLQLNTGSTPGDINFNYMDLDSGDSRTNAASASVGIKDSGTQGNNRLLISNSGTSPYVGSYKSLRFNWAAPTTVTVTNALPVVSAPAAQSGEDGVDVNWNLGSFSDLGLKDSPWTVDVDWGDGTLPHATFSTTNPGTLGSRQHRYTSQGSHTVTVQVTDKDGGVGSKTFPVTVTAPPLVVVDITGTPATSSEGTAITLGCSLTNTTGQTPSYSWGVTSPSGKTYKLDSPTNGSEFTFTPNDDGDYLVSCSVTADGLTSTDTETVHATNVAPTALLTQPAPIYEGGSITMAFANPTDPSSDDVSAGLRYSFALTEQALAPDYDHALPTSSAQFTFANSGTYPIYCGIYDNDGGIRRYDTSVNVQAAPFDLTISGANSASEGSTYVLELLSTGLQQASIYSWTIDWGDGSDPDDDGTVGECILRDGTQDNPFSVAHIYDNGPNTYSIVARATNQGGTYRVTRTKTVGISNVPPLSMLSQPTGANEGDSVTVWMSNPVDPSSADRAAGFRYSFALSEQGLATDRDHASPEPSATFTFANDRIGGYVIWGRVFDQDGGYCTSSSVVLVNNVAPVVNVPSSATLDEGGTFTASGSFTDPGTDNWSATVDYGDDSGVQPLTLRPDKTFDLSHPYTNSGTYTVRIIVNDGSAIGEGDIVVTVNDVAPILDVTGSGSVGGVINENTTYTLTFSASDIPGDIISSWAIDWGDGSPVETVNAAAGSLTHQFRNVFYAYIWISATDQEGTYDADPIELSVLRKFSITGAEVVDEGSPYTLTLATSSAVEGSVTGWTIDWGDGSDPDHDGLVGQKVIGGPASITHTYADDNGFGYSITASGTDQAGTFWAEPIYVMVNDVPRPVSMSGAASVDEGATYTLSLSYGSDPGTDTLDHWVVDWGDDTVDTIAVSPTDPNPRLVTHAYNGLESTRTIYACAYDEEGGNDAAPLTVTINNKPPTASISGSDSTSKGSVYTLNLSATDPGQDFIKKWSLDWGDGSSGTIYGNPTSVTHIYTTDGSYIIRATAYDKDDGYNLTPVQQPVTVSSPARTIALSGDAYFNWSEAYQLQLSTNNASAGPVTWTINWGDGSAIQTTSGATAAVRHLYNKPDPDPNPTTTKAYTITVTATDAQGLNATATQGTAESPGMKSIYYSLKTPVVAGFYIVDDWQCPDYIPDWEYTSKYILVTNPKDTIKQLVAGTITLPAGDSIDGSSHQYSFPGDCPCDIQVTEVGGDGKLYASLLFNPPEKKPGAVLASGVVFTPNYVSITPYRKIDGAETSNNVGIAHESEADDPRIESGFKVSLQPGITFTEPITVELRLSSEGTATMGSDYTLSKSSVTLSQSHSEECVPLTVVNDDQSEWTEDVVVDAVPDHAATSPMSSQARIAIGSDDVQMDVPDGVWEADCDDDNQNGIPDNAEPSMPNTDLYTVSLHVPQQPKSGTSIELTAPPNLVRVWSPEGELLIGPGVGYSKEWPDGADVPDSVKVQVLAGSYSSGAISIGLYLYDTPVTYAAQVAARDAAEVTMWWHDPTTGTDIQVTEGKRMPDVIIGQIIKPSVKIVAPGKIDYTWTQPEGDIFDSYKVIVTADSSSGSVVPFDPTQLKQSSKATDNPKTSSIHFVWKAEKEANRTVSVKVDIPGWPKTLSTQVKVLVPKSSARGWRHLAPQLAPPNPRHNYWTLGLSERGMFFEGSVNPKVGTEENLKDFGGEWNFVQLWKPNRTWTVNNEKVPVRGDKEEKNWGLDGTYPYMDWLAPAFRYVIGNPASAWVANGVSRRTADYPHLNLIRQDSTGASIDDVWQMWMMYRPAGGEWVPLCEMSWSLSVACTRNGVNGKWIRSGEGSMTPPAGDPGVAFKPTTQFPEWSLLHPLG